MKSANDSQRILRLASQRGMLRPRALKGSGGSRATLSRLVASGALQRLSRGVYALADCNLSGNYQLAEVTTRCPHGVVCLLSALRFHDLTTQNPHQIWLAIANKARAPKIDYPPLRIVRLSGPALTDGIENHKIDGVSVQIYSVAKTVADCFKFRNKIGVAVALEALRECHRGKRATIDAIWKHAEKIRVANVMRPYLESL